MKPSPFSKTLMYLVLTLVCVTSVGCGPNFGEQLVIEKTGIFYKDGATRADAEKLGKKLKEMKFIDGKSKSVQLLKRGDVWEFRIATAKSEQQEAVKNPLRLYCLELSSVFDGDEVEVHICNQKLESKAIVKGRRGKVYRLGKNSYYYRDVDLDQVKKFAGIAYATLLDTSTGFNYHLSRPENTVEIRMAYPKAVKDDKRMETAATATAVAASKKLFDGKQVDVCICDPFFTTQFYCSSSSKAAKQTP